jgi:RNA polymerase sigma-70 factor, ECF subfamily
MDTLTLSPEEVILIASESPSLEGSRRDLAGYSGTARFDAMYRQVHPDLLRFISRRLVPPDQYLAEEMAHDTFTKAWQRRAELPDDIGELRAYLFTVARNFLIKSNERGYRNRELSIRISDDASGYIPSPNDDIGARTMQLDLATAWAQLSPREQEVIALTYWDNLTSDAAGKVLGISDRAYRKRLHHARAHLKTLLNL